MFLGTGVWLPYVPLWLADLGLQGWEIGIVAGVQPALRWLSALAVAALADRRRARHRLLVRMGLAGALCFVPLLVVRDFPALVIVCSAIALLHGPLIPLVDAIVVDHLEGLGGDYGRLRVAGSMAFVLGALLSAPLVRLFSPAIVPWLLLGAQVGLVPALARLPPGQLGHAGEVRSPWALATPPMRAFLATAFLLQVSCGAWGGFFALHTAALGLPDTVPGITWALAVGVEIVLFTWGRGLIGRIAAERLVGFALVVTVVRWALTAVATSAPAVMALQLAHACTFSVFHLATIGLLAKLVPPASTTSGQGLYGMVAFGLGGSLGLGLAGVLVDRVGTSAVFGIEAVIAAAALLPAVALLRRLR